MLAASDRLPSAQQHSKAGEGAILLSIAGWNIPTFRCPAPIEPVVTERFLQRVKDVLNKATMKVREHTSCPEAPPLASGSRIHSQTLARSKRNGTIHYPM